MIFFTKKGVFYIVPSEFLIENRMIDKFNNKVKTI